jgi:hypothetical protein
MEKSCLNCQETIRGRSDKKFCDDQCRNQYNNGMLRHVNNRMRNINNILKRNRRILAQLKEQREIKIDELIANGFHFAYFTHFDEQRKTKYIFDIGYQVASNERVLIVQE